MWSERIVMIGCLPAGTLRWVVQKAGVEARRRGKSVINKN
jgi:hypothetical protein